MNGQGATCVRVRVQVEVQVSGGPTLKPGPEGSAL